VSAIKPRVLFISGREVEYMRNRVLLAALHKHFEVTVGTTRARSTVVRTTASLLKFATSSRAYDVCWAGFYGQPLAIALALLQRQPIVLDAYLSTFDTLVEDRGRFGARSPAGRLAYWLDARGCTAATRIVTDTAAGAGYFTETFGIPARRLTPIYVGCDERIFCPRPTEPSTRDGCEVFYYGAFLPLHGTSVIVDAAALLRERKDIHFTLGGAGMQFRATKQLVQRLGLTNVDFLDWIPLHELPERIASATVCLGGHFSTIPKAARVVPTKSFQFIAMRKATVVGDNVANRELFVHGENAFAVPMGNATALADAIACLADDELLRDRLAAGGYNLFQERLTTEAIARQLSKVIDEALCASAW
jgi:glycosyltransferase involved in cell wall biosynthesis